MYNGYIGEVVQADATYFRCKTLQLTHNDFMSPSLKDYSRNCVAVSPSSLRLSRKSENTQVPHCLHLSSNVRSFQLCLNLSNFKANPRTEPGEVQYWSASNKQRHDKFFSKNAQCEINDIYNDCRSAVLGSNDSVGNIAC